MLSHDKLVRYTPSSSAQEILWKDRMMVLKNTHYSVVMSGDKFLDGSKDILCINSTYALIVGAQEVIYMVM